MNTYKCFLTVVVTTLVIYFFASYQQTSREVRADVDDIAKKIIRLHIIANSDSEDDQKLKIKVRDEIVSYLKPMMDETNDIESARDIINENMDALDDIALKVISDNNYDYDVDISLTHATFPTKKYGQLTLPPGEYEALKIEIGEGLGHNWWCVMYPSLCFIDCGTVTLGDDSKSRLKSVLTYEEYESVMSDENSTIEYDLRIREWFNLD